MSDNPLTPSIQVLCKVGSIVGHVEEAISSDGHEFDWVAIRVLIADPDVQRWLGAMGARSFIPLKRASGKSGANT